MWVSGKCLSCADLVLERDESSRALAACDSIKLGYGFLQRKVNDIFEIIMYVKIQFIRVMALLIKNEKGQPVLPAILKIRVHMNTGEK